MQRDTSTFGSLSRQHLSNSQYEKRTNRFTNLDVHLLPYGSFCCNESKPVYMALDSKAYNAVFMGLGHYLFGKE